MIKEGIQKLVEGRNLTFEESRGVMKEIMSGNATDAQIGAFLATLRIKGETIEEVTAFVEVMREFCCRIHPKVRGRLVDTAGTGGDRIKTFNISTTSAFVIAGAGIPVAKHGNRSVTSNSGSADVLENLGLNFEVDPAVVGETIERVGIGFMFSPAFHPAMKYATEPRREIGIRTVFGILGPLTNPANANAQLLGVYDVSLVKPLANVLRNLGCEEAMVVHGLDGLDEVSTVGKTSIAWLRENEVTVLEKAPRDFGVKTAKPEEIRGSTPQESAEITFKVLNGYTGPDDPRRDIVLVNAAAGIIVGGKADDFSYGMDLARQSVDSGLAYKKLRMLVKAYGGSLSRLEELELKYG